MKESSGCCCFMVFCSMDFLYVFVGIDRFWRVDSELIFGDIYIYIYRVSSCSHRPSWLHIILQNWMQQKLVPFNLLFPSNFNLRLQIANFNPSPADVGRIRWETRSKKDPPGPKASKGPRQ